MKIAVVGATGNAGPKIVSELLSRGHSVTAISRHPEKLGAAPGLTLVAGDIDAPEALARALAGHDVVISSVRFADFDFDRMMRAIKGSGVPRYLVVGGAGSLRDVGGGLVHERPTMPDPVRHNSQLGADWLEMLKTSDLNWTMLCPGLRFIEGERTGVFRLGQDDLIVGEDGVSVISFQDFAVAMVDEIEAPQHQRSRFAVGY